jgi:uncharacterized cupin superfamily protein
MSDATSVPEASLVRAEHGLRPDSAGWFVLNVADAQWQEHTRFGRYCAFEGEQRFPHLGVNVHVLQPGQPACMYHSEAQGEAFLVLSGKCLLIVEERERELCAWDFFHCPAGTRHVFVGAGDGPCAILMIGARLGDEGLHYPVSPVAGARGAAVATSTHDPREAYRGSGSRAPIPANWPL